MQAVHYQFDGFELELVRRALIRYIQAPINISPGEKETGQELITRMNRDLRNLGENEL